MSTPGSPEGRPSPESNIDTAKRDNLESKAKQLLSQIENMEAKLPSLSSDEESQDEIKSAYDALKESLKKRKEAIDQNTKSLTDAKDNDTLKTVEQALSSTADLLKDLENDLQSVEKKREAFKAQIEVKQKSLEGFSDLEAKALALKTGIDHDPSEFPATDAEKNQLNQITTKLKSIASTLQNEDATKLDKQTLDQTLESAQHEFNKLEQTLIQRKWGLLRGPNYIPAQIDTEITDLRSRPEEDNSALIAQLENLKQYFEQLRTRLTTSKPGSQTEIYTEKKDEVTAKMAELARLAPERFDKEVIARKEGEKATLQEKIEAANTLGCLATEATPIADQALQNKIGEQLLLLNQMTPEELRYEEDNAELTQEQKEMRTAFLENRRMVRETVVKALLNNLPEQTEAQRQRKAELEGLLQQDGIGGTDYQPALDRYVEWLKSGEATEAEVKAFDRLVRLAVTERLVVERTQHITNMIDQRIKSLRTSNGKNKLVQMLTVVGGAFGGSALRNIFIGAGFGTAANTVGAVGAISASRALSGVAGLAAGAITGGVAGYISGDIRAKQEARRAGLIIRDLEEGFYEDPNTRKQRKLTEQEKATILMDMLEGRKHTMLRAVKLGNREIIPAWERNESFIDITEESREAVLSIIQAHYQTVAQRELQAALAAVESDTENLSDYTVEENLARALTALCKAHEEGSELLKRDNLTKYVATNKRGVSPEQANARESTIQDDTPGGPKISRRIGTYDMVHKFINEREDGIKEKRRAATLKGALMGAGLGGVFGYLFPAPTLASKLGAEWAVKEPAHIAANNVSGAVTEFTSQGNHAAKMAFLESHHYNLKDAYTILESKASDPSAVSMARSIIEHNLHIDLSSTTAVEPGAIPGRDLMHDVLRVVRNGSLLNHGDSENSIRALYHLLSHPSETHTYILDALKEAAHSGLGGREFTDAVMNHNPHDIAKSITSYHRQAELWDKSHAPWKNHGFLEARMISERYLPFGTETTLFGLPVDHFLGFALISFLAHKTNQDKTFLERLGDYSTYEKINRDWRNNEIKENGERKTKSKTKVHTFRPDIFEDDSEVDPASRTEVNVDRTKWIQTYPALHGTFVIKRDPAEPTNKDKMRVFRLSPHKPPTGIEAHDATSDESNTKKAQLRRMGNEDPDMGMMLSGTLQVREYKLDEVFEEDANGNLIMLPPSKQEARWRESRLLPTNLGKNRHQLISKNYREVFDVSGDAISFMAIDPKEIAQYAYALSKGLIKDASKPTPYIDKIVKLGFPEDEEPTSDNPDQDNPHDDNNGNGGGASSNNPPNPTPPVPPTPQNPTGSTGSGTQPTSTASTVSADPNPQPAPDAATAALDTENPVEPETTHTPEEIRNTIKEYLYYLDIQSDDSREALEKTIDSGEDYPSKESAEKYANALLDLFAKNGEALVERTVTNIRDAFTDTMNKLGLTPKAYSASKSWAYWDVAKQYHYYTHPTESDSSRYLIDNPMKNREVQQAIIDRHVGWDVASQVYGLEYQSYNYDTIEHLRAMNNMTEAERAQYLSKVLVDNGLESLVASSQGEQILNLLAKEGKSGGSRSKGHKNQLSSSELVELGSLIREAINTVDATNNTPPAEPTSDRQQALNTFGEQLRQLREQRAATEAERQQALKSLGQQLRQLQEEKQQTQPTIPASPTTPEPSESTAAPAPELSAPEAPENTVVTEFLSQTPELQDIQDDDVVRAFLLEAHQRGRDLGTLTDIARSVHEGQLDKDARENVLDMLEALEGNEE